MPASSSESQLPAGEPKRAKVDPRSDFPHDSTRNVTDKSPLSDDKSIRINPWYLTDEFTVPFSAAYTSPSVTDTRTITQSGASNAAQGTIVGHPFHTGKLSNVFPPTFLRSLQDELRTLNWHKRSNDLYLFNQTDDLALNAKPHIKALRHYLAGDEFVGFMEKITGLDLTRGYLDLAAQRYKDGNHLLCHDDDVHRGKLARRIAYIIYLVDEDWCEADGGALGLFDNDENKHPTKVVQRLVPEFNSIGFFRTGLVSYHTVEEVTVKDENRERWSVTGWFYGPVTDDITPSEATLPPLPSDVLPEVTPLDTSPYNESNDPKTWAKWVTDGYLNSDAQSKIEDAIMDQSSIELKRFLRPEIIQALEKECSAEFWKTHTKCVGPPHVRQYHKATVTSSTPVLEELTRFLHSASFARLIRKFTSLRFSRASQEVRRFSKGCYTLIHDQAIEPSGLDVVLSLPSPEPHGEDSWDADMWGGATHYIADKDELLRILPETNTLSLVFRDEGTLRFVKYLTHNAERTRQEISMVFVEDDAEE